MYISYRLSWIISQGVRRRVFVSYICVSVIDGKYRDKVLLQSEVKTLTDIHAWDKL